MKKYEVEGHEPSLVPENGNWILVWSDEFDGETLDESKWSFRRNFWGKPFQTFTDEGVVLDGKSNLKLYLTEKNGNYYSPHLQTGANSFDNPKDNEESFYPLGKLDKPKFMHKYGYYEIRCELQKQPGWWSAFWLQSPCIGTTYDTSKSGVEVDIMENFTRDGEITSGNIYGGYANGFTESARIKYKIENSMDEYHLFGVEWSKEGYTFYCDGKETARSDGPVSEVEQFILVSTECKGYREGDMDTPDKELQNAVLPDCFTIDFVRVFDEIE